MPELIVATLPKTSQDLTNQRFGRLVAIQFLGFDSRKKQLWEFECDCGNTITAHACNVKSGKTKSCGCLRAEAMRKTATTHGRTAGGKQDRLLNIFYGLKSRCADLNDKDYGGKGVKCLWQSPEEFIRDMEAGYADHLTIDRIDGNGHYCKENCRWATQKQQNRNYSRNRFLTFNGQTKTLVEWAESIGMDQRSFRSRLARGWSIEKALTTPYVLSKR
jgi:hypothetical protein